MLADSLVKAIYDSMGRKMPEERELRPLPEPEHCNYGMPHVLIEGARSVYKSVSDAYSRFLTKRRNTPLSEDQVKRLKRLEATTPELKFQPIENLESRAGDGVVETMFPEVFRIEYNGRPWIGDVYGNKVAVAPHLNNTADTEITLMIQRIEEELFDEM